MPTRANKVVILGVGDVGATTAYALMMSALVSEIVLVDINEDLARGEALDLSHSAAFVSPVRVRAGGYEDCAGASIVVITAGVNQRPGETRLDLINKNIAIYQEILPKILKYCPDSIYLIVSNPVDILTYITVNITGLPTERVIGSGTVLDTSRFRYLLSEHCDVDPRNIHAYVVGEHGDTEVPVWSLANVGGVPLETFCKLKELTYTPQWQSEISTQVRRAAYEIIDLKGSTYYAVGLALVRIIQTILRDERALLTVSTPLQGFHGIYDVALSLPAILGRSGISQVLPMPLNDQEEEQLQHSAATLKEAIKNSKL